MSRQGGVPAPAEIEEEAALLLKEGVPAPAEIVEEVLLPKEGVAAFARAEATEARLSLLVLF